jgi:hypothetical protein
MSNFIKNKGNTILASLIFGSVAIVIITGLVGWFGGLMRSMRTLEQQEQAFQVAEAGIDYYRWHLAHFRDDYKDGTNSSGPYVHVFYDKDGNAIGEYSLDITAPPVGSTMVTITSTGKVYSNNNITRKIRARLAIPSLAKYAAVTNEANRYGEGTEVFGPIHANGGVRFDGLAHNIITSTVASYDDPDHTGGVEFGVHTHVSSTTHTVDDTYRPAEAPPNAVQNRTDVFMAGRSFPVPAFDFSGLTADITDIKTDAQTSGRYFSGSGSYGYHVVLKTNDTFDLYKVTSLYKVNGACKNDGDQDGWGSWGIDKETFLANYTLPANGLMFFEDHVWVDGQIDGIRLTIAAGKFPDNSTDRKNIIITKDLLYTRKDGTDAIALIAQNNVLVGINSEDNLEIDAALVAQNGFVGRFYYHKAFCNFYQIRDTLTLFGMIASNQRYGFAYSDGTGYTIRNIIYDANLLYSPPPSFPLSGDQYQLISWEEIK